MSNDLTCKMRKILLMMLGSKGMFKFFPPYAAP